MSEIKEIPSCCMNCDMFRVFDGQCSITNTYIDDYLYIIRTNDSLNYGIEGHKVN